MRPVNITTTGGSQFDPVEENIDLSPADSAAEKIVKESVSLIATISSPLVSPVAPVLVEIFKSVANVLGFFGQRRKAERASDLALALYDLLQRTRSEHVKKEEFQDLFEEVLRRTAEQPDAARRENMKRIFFRIIEEPHEHVENRLLLRLADELPADSLKILAVLDQDLTQEEGDLGTGHHALVLRLGSTPSGINWPLNYLVNENLVDKESFNVQPGFGAAGDDLMFLLTPLGRTFV
jgi:hypothetical protein